MKVGNYRIYYVIMALWLMGCTEMDEYKRYLADGELLYAGKISSVLMYPGNERLMVTGILQSDPNIVQCNVYWNSRQDSLIIPIERTANVDTITAMLSPMPEGVWGFELVTYDSYGHASVIVNATGTVYGPRYSNALLNRGIVSYEMTRDSDYEDAELEWVRADDTSGMLGVEMVYDDENGETQSLTILAEETITSLEGFEPDQYIYYRSMFKPDTLCMDTFYTAYDSIWLSHPLLKNNVSTFLDIDNNGRWGILKDWITNDAAKSHSGYGGWDYGLFNVETGWGEPDVTNAKIYQTNTLIPGTYTFKISVLNGTNLTEEDPAYLVAAVGSDLPDVEAIETAIAYASIPDMGITFTIDAETEVSVGFLSSQSGNKYCKVEEFEFYRHKQ